MYERLRSEDATHGARMIYDQRVLHLMSPSRRHEHVAEILNRMTQSFTTGLPKVDKLFGIEEDMSQIRPGLLISH